MTKILVIEDTAEIRENILDFLEAEDFEVMAATDGRSGLELARQNQFDLILCDIMMPEMDGYAVITELRQNSATADIPFIFLTAKSDRSDLRLGMNLGADDYLTKPFTPNELLEAITARLNRAVQQTEKLRQISEQLEQLENFDSVTGLPKQSALLEEGGYWQQAIANIERSRQLIPFLFLGLDRFSRINDTIGYSIGDLILKNIGQRLADFARRVAGSVVRIGGDQFALILPPVSEQKAAEEISEDLLKLIAQPLEIDSKSILLTASIGIGFYPIALSLEEVQRQASIAMGAAKRGGGNRSSIYNRPIFGHDAAKDLQLAAELHSAWERKALQIFYQPRIDLRNKKIVALATVLHWQHPVRGNISLEKILSLAQEAGLIIPINEWVLRTACQQIKVWQNSGISVRLAISISEPLFANKQLEEIVIGSYQEANIEPNSLELEIAADPIAKTSNLNATAARLMAWQKLGIQTTLSKFGIGHSTIDYLEQLALNNIKVERSLTIGNSSNTPILNAIVEMAHRLKLKVLAEGVETEAQATFLKKHKFDQIQQEISFPAQQIQSQKLSWIPGLSSEPVLRFF